MIRILEGQIHLLCVYANYVMLPNIGNEEKDRYIDIIEKEKKIGGRGRGGSGWRAERLEKTLNE